VFSYVSGDDGHGVVINGDNLVLLVGEQLTSQQLDRLRHVVEHASVDEVLSQLQAPSGVGLSHYALVTTRGGAINELTVSVGGRMSAMTQQTSRTELPIEAEPAELPAAELSPPPVDDANLTGAELTGLFDHLFEHTQFHDVEAAAVRATTEEPFAFSLTMPDGNKQVIDRPVLIGRGPEAPRDADLSQLHLMKLGDRESGVSRTHARIDPLPDGVKVTDLGSTNGTAIAHPSGEVTTLTPHQPGKAKAGDQILLSKSITVAVTANKA